MNRNHLQKNFYLFSFRKTKTEVLLKSEGIILIGTFEMILLFSMAVHRVCV